MKNGFEGEYIQALWKTAKKDLIHDVGMILNADAKTIPHWMSKFHHGPFDYESWESDSDKVDYRIGFTSDYYCTTPSLSYGKGYLLPIFLYNIGPANAANIRTIDISFDNLIGCAYHFQMYVEILKQHMPKLRKLIIGRSPLPFQFKEQSVHKMTDSSVLRI